MCIPMAEVDLTYGVLLGTRRRLHTMRFMLIIRLLMLVLMIDKPPEQQVVSTLPLDIMQGNHSRLISTSERELYPSTHDNGSSSSGTPYHGSYEQRYTQREPTAQDNHRQLSHLTSVNPSQPLAQDFTPAGHSLGAVLDRNEPYAANVDLSSHLHRPSYYEQVTSLRLETPQATPQAVTHNISRTTQSVSPRTRSSELRESLHQPRSQVLPRAPELRKHREQTRHITWKMRSQDPIFSEPYSPTFPSIELSPEPAPVNGIVTSLEDQIEEIIRSLERPSSRSQSNSIICE